MKKNKSVLIFFFSTVIQLVTAQETLTVEQAIDVALKNNYDISISKSNAEIAANNNNTGNAGMLPRVDLNAAVNLATNNTKQEFSSGLEVNKAGVRSDNTSAGIYLTWTLFDGLKMFATHERLAELEAIGDLNMKLRIEETVAGVVLAYYNIVRQKQLLKGLSENISISKERLDIAKKKSDIGSGSGLDVLQSQVDLNSQTSLLYRQQTQLAQFKIDLNQLLARPSETEYEVADSIPVDFSLNFTDLQTKMNKENLSLLLAQRSVKVSGEIVKETRSLFFPKVNFVANYQFSRAQSAAGFALLNQNLGFNYGFTASWNIFNGFNNSKQFQNAQLQAVIAETDLHNTQSQLNAQLMATFRVYLDDQKILKLEEENAGIARQAVDIALERFRIGSSNSIELRQIQQSYEDALVRLADARYNARVTETRLMKLNGTIVH